MLAVYGLTEGGVLIFMTPSNVDASGCVGVPLPGVEFKVILSLSLYLSPTLPLSPSLPDPPRRRRFSNVLPGRVVGEDGDDGYRILAWRRVSLDKSLNARKTERTGNK